MKKMYANIKKALKAILANYITAMEMYGEALNRSRGCDDSHRAYSVS